VADLKSIREWEPSDELRAGHPVTPRPSASIVLLRRGGRHTSRGLQVLMAKRTESARFMPGFWVFPGGAVDPGDGPAGEEQALRVCAVRELAEEVGIALSPEAELIPFAHWITPEPLPIRFDAWFFLALAPRHAPPKPDASETVDAGWFTPEEVLREHEAGRMVISFPTVHQLRDLARFATAEEAVAHYRERQPQPILPKPIESDEGVRLSLPGDEDYPA
jgi:8-oxo-dGTP pyrophosphatase MutT (NUDIX family)